MDLALGYRHTYPYIDPVVSRTWMHVVRIWIVIACMAVSRNF
jgi:hypothetical protein